MHPTLDAVLNKTAYEKLPECIRHTLSEREWSFLTDAQKANLEQSQSEPETEL